MLPIIYLYKIQSNINIYTILMIYFNYLIFIIKNKINTYYIINTHIYLYIYIYISLYNIIPYTFKYLTSNYTNLSEQNLVYLSF